MKLAIVQSAVVAPRARARFSLVYRWSHRKAMVLIALGRTGPRVTPDLPCRSLNLIIVYMPPAAFDASTYE